MALGTEWLEDAECTRRVDPELFFGAANGLTGSALEMSETAAKAVCARCGVTEDCLLYALATKQTHGVWGGLTAAERETLLGRATEVAS